MARATIVTTTKLPGLPIQSFVDYHLKIGFEHLFIFYEGGLDPALSRVAQVNGVTLIATDAALEREWRKLTSFALVSAFLDREVMARQILNAECAVQRSRELGADWLLHLDSDELFVPETGTVPEHFDALSRKAPVDVVYSNHEAVPETDEIGDYFREVTLFKTNKRFISDQARALRFIAHGAGKAAANLHAEPFPLGVHRFRSRCQHPRRLWSRRSFILHYPSCGFERFLTKYRLLGAFDDRWFEQVSIKEHMAFHAAARDLVAAGDLAGARELYRERVLLQDLDAEARRHLIHQGLLLRVTDAARALQG